MKCNELRFDDHPYESEDWLFKTQTALCQAWTLRTNHRDGASYGTWACEIANSCRTCNEHLSLPCSLLAEANEIGTFLMAKCFSSEPATFLRLYLIILSEFASQLEQIDHLMSLKIGKKPRLVTLWANRWAKHRLHILLQHHPVMAFADSYGDRWSEIERLIRFEQHKDRHGNTLTVRIIDTKWLETNNGKSIQEDPNGPGRAVILVPPMMFFLDEITRYFREFVDACLKSPERVRRFESVHFRQG